MNTLLWTIYGIGIVLTPIVCGALCKDKPLWTVENGICLFFLSFLWPIVPMSVLFVVALVLVGLPFVVVGFVLGCLWKVLLLVGSNIPTKFKKRIQQ